MRRVVRGAVIAVVMVGAMGLAGCAPEAAPTPTPTALTEAEAFAAAEATYRAYVDALNAVDLSDPETFEPVFALTTGKSNSALRTEFSQMHADGYEVTGDSVIELLEPVAANEDGIQLAVCLSVADVDLRDDSGSSVVPEDRADVQSLYVVVTHGQVSSTTARDGEPTCS